MFEQNKSARLSNQCVVIAALVLLLSAAAGAATVESVQRKYQARYKWLYPGSQLSWPACQSTCTSCGSPATAAFPPEGWYGEEADPAFKAKLVADLCNKFWVSAKIYPSFRTTSVEGSAWSTYPPVFTTTEMPQISASSTNPLMFTSNGSTMNADAALARIDSYLDQLKLILLTSSTGVAEGQAKFGSATADDCGSVVADAQSAFDSAEWGSSSPNGMTFDEVVSGYNDYNNPYNKSVATISSSRARITWNLTSYANRPGSAKLFVCAAQKGAGVSNAPSGLTVDSTYHAFGGNPSLGQTGQTGLVEASSHTFTMSCPQNPGQSKGWEVKDSVIEVEPSFTESPGSGSTCGSSGGGGSTGACPVGSGGPWGSAASNPYGNSYAGSAFAHSLAAVDGGGSRAGFRYNMGLTAADSSAGELMLSEEVPAPELATPARLAWVKVADVTMGPRQAHTGHYMADVVREPNDALGKSYKYHIRYYKANQVSAYPMGSPPLYTVNVGQENNWFKQVMVENPDWTPGTALTAYNRLKVTESSAYGTVRDIYEYEYNSTDRNWILKTGWDATAGQYARWQQRTVQYANNETERTETLTVRRNSASGVIDSQQVFTYQKKGWNWELTQAQTGSSLQQSRTFYEDELNDGDNYAKLKQVTYPSGYWERYTYDVHGRVNKIVSPYHNGDPTAAESASKVTEIVHEEVDVLNGAGRPGTDSKADVKVTYIEKLNGAEVSRRYTIGCYGTSYNYTWDVKCPSTGLAWNDAANAVTITESNRVDGSTYQGKPRYILRTNGTVSRYDEYTTFTYGATESHAQFGTLTKLTVDSGIANSTGNGVAFGMRTLAKQTAKGAKVFAESYPIDGGTANTNVKLSSALCPGSSSLDSFGRVTRLNYLDGTYETFQYGCCYLEEHRDRQGVTTSYVYDVLGRLTAEVHASGTDGALTKLYAHDAQGRVLTVKRKGTDNVEHTVATYTYDSAGRRSKGVDALGHNHYTMYRTFTDSGKTYYETRQYPHEKSAGPVQVMWADGEGHTVREWLGTPASDWAPNAPTGTESLTELARTEQEYGCCGELELQRQWHDLSSGTGYYDTTYVYDAMDRLLRVTDPVGDITATVYNAAGDAAATWRGTNASGATAADPSGGGASGNDMVKVSESFYDTNRDGTGDRRPFVTRSKGLKSTGAVQWTYADYDYDSYRRLEWTKPESATGGLPWTQQQYDSVGRPTDTITYRNGSTTYVIGKRSDSYTTLGQLSSRKQYEVNGSGAATANYMETVYAYDAAGRTVKTTRSSGGYDKTLYDVLGRVSTRAFCSDEGADTTTSTLADDTVLTMSAPSFDACDNVIQTTSNARNHDGTGTGALTTSNSRVTYAVAYYDTGDRPTHQVNYGTNGGSAFTRPSTAVEPNTSDDYIVSKMIYDDVGRVKDSIDNKGIVSRSTYDHLGRRTKLIENYVDGTPSNSDDRTTVWTYTAAGAIATLTADMPSGTTDQSTTYVYSQSLTDKGSIVKSNGYLRAVIYPDSDDVVSFNALANGTDATYDRVEYTYMADGQVETTKEQRGVVRTFAYDASSRLTSDMVTTLPTGVDGAVRRIERTYTDVSLPEKLTSYDAASSGSVVNEVKLTYNGWSQVTKSEQEHAGVVVPGTSKAVQYGYSAITGATFPRPSSMTYPSGRVIYYNLPSSGIGAATNRLDNIGDDSSGTTKYAQYEYMGDGMIITAKRPSVTNGLQLTYGTSANSYSGLDRFGRVIDQKWQNDAGTSTFDRFTYGYDRGGNRTYKDNTLTTLKDEFYASDGLHRLSNMGRGDLNGTFTAISGTPEKEEDWSLDALGNWNAYLTKASGTTDLDQSRTHNAVNEITGITNSVGTAWVTTTHDAAGNMTSCPKGDDPTVRIHLSYDGWNRMTEVKADSGGSPGSTIGTYRYDGRNHRVRRIFGVDSFDDYNTERQQLIEVRKGVVLQEQYLWEDERYVDALIVRWRDTDENGVVDETIYALQDPNFNVTALLIPAGTVQERYAYEPYGQRLVLNATFGLNTSSGYLWRHAHQGLEIDTFGFYANRSRIRHPTLGRFLTRDQETYVDGLSMYQMLGSNPYRFLDSTGNAVKTCQELLVFWDSVWHYSGRTIVGSQVGPATGTPAVACFTQIAIYYKKYARLIKCCDQNNLAYVEWHLGSLLGSAESVSPLHNGSATETGVPIAIPLPYGQVIDVSAWLGTENWKWLPGQPPYWHNRPHEPNNVAPMTPAAEHLGNSYNIVGTVNCSAGWAPGAHIIAQNPPSF